MSKPEVTREEMLEYINWRIRYYKTAIEACHGTWFEGEGNILKVILHLIEEHGELRKKVREWKKRAMRILGEYYIEDIEITELLREIRDFGKKKNEQQESSTR